MNQDNASSKLKERNRKMIRMNLIAVSEPKVPPSTTPTWVAEYEVDYLFDEPQDTLEFRINEERICYVKSVQAPWYKADHVANKLEELHKKNPQLTRIQNQTAAKERRILAISRAETFVDTQPKASAQKYLVKQYKLWHRLLKNKKLRDYYGHSHSGVGGVINSLLTLAEEVGLPVKATSYVAYGDDIVLHDMEIKGKTQDFTKEDWQNQGQ